jgi:TM2 domain-containing membrane protein YozV
MPAIPRTSDPAVIEHRLLDLAYTTDSMLTPPLLAYYAPCSIEDAERVLDRLASEGRLELEVTDDGSLRYEMPNRQRIAAPAQTAMMRREVADVAPYHQPNPIAAAVLSAIVPGAGQLYAGRPLSAIAWFTVVTMGYLLLVIPGVVLHILCIASAAGGAHRMRPITA